MYVERINVSVPVVVLLSSLILQTLCKMKCIVTIVSTISLCQIWTGLDLLFASDVEYSKNSDFKTLRYA